MECLRTGRLAAVFLWHIAWHARLGSVSDPVSVHFVFRRQRVFERPLGRQLDLLRQQLDFANDCRHCEQRFAERVPGYAFEDHR